MSAASTVRRHKLNVARVCEFCGKSFLSCASHINYGRGRFCSRICGDTSRQLKASIETIEQNSIPEPNSGCWLWTGYATGAGYGATRRAGKWVLAHRLSYELYKSDIDAGIVVRHRCDNSICVNPDHLEIGSAGDNVRDSVRRGRISRGERRPAAKLTAAQVIAIRAQHAEGIPNRVIAEMFGVSADNIRLIAKRRAWRHVA